MENSKIFNRGKTAPEWRSLPDGDPLRAFPMYEEESVSIAEFLTAEELHGVLRVIKRELRSLRTGSSIETHSATSVLAPLLSGEELTVGQVAARSLLAPIDADRSLSDLVDLGLVERTMQDNEYFYRLQD